MKSKNYDLVVQNTESTVVAEFTPTYSRAKSYQSEADLEKSFIEQLQTQAYEYLSISSEEDLIKNLRKQLEKLNNYKFSDNEWDQFFKSEIANPNQSVAEKTTTIQEDSVKNLKRDDGSVKNSFRDGIISTTGTAISKVLPPVSRFSKTGERTRKRESVIEKFTRFFDRFFDIFDKE